MLRDPSEDDTARLASRSLAAGDPTGWFDALYREAVEGAATVPWDRPAPSASLVEFVRSAALPAHGSTAVVVGCGPGRDAEFVASLGFVTTGFDVAPAAIEQARARRRSSTVTYEVADLLALPARWLGAFALVVESNNVQSLPPDLHEPATRAVTSLLAPGGTLLVLSAEAPDPGPGSGPPWPLTSAEIAAFGTDLETVRVDAVADAGGGVRRWRAEFRRPPEAAG